jgi:AcrR family transcriptional regulator
MAKKRPPQALDGNAVRTMRTRARILEASLALFNEHGEAHVTTGMIADELNISPGNLYYHFANKDEIVERLFARFEERIDVNLGAAPEGSPAADVIEDLWFYLHLMFEAIWDYRFLYRNLDDLMHRSRLLREHFNRIAEHKLAAIEALCRELVRAKAMRAAPGEIRALAGNVLLVATYWLNYQSLVRHRVDPQSTLGTGVYQVMALVAPFLVGPARRHLEHLMENYTS